jgi:hypothetical protein
LPLLTFDSLQLLAVWGETQKWRQRGGQIEF